MRKFIQAVVLASALALPTFFASNAFAIPNCGTNCTSATKNPHGYTAATPVNCYSCHTAGTTGGGIGGGVTGGTLTVKPTSKNCGACAVGTAPSGVGAHKNVTATTICSVCHVITSTGGTVGIYPTRHSCEACVIGTAPGSVSAHKNVNANSTVCSVCHLPSSTGGIGGSTGGHTDNDHGTTGGTTGGYDDHHKTSPDNSDFGHSHKRDGKNQHRDHDD
jgi:hypothetical protein